MDNKNTNTKIDVSRELHSNLMLVTTSVAMIGFVVLMLIYMAMKNPGLIALATGTARFGGIAACAVAALLAFNSVKHNKKYFIEYMIYCLIMGFGLTFMFSVPFFAMPLVLKFNITNWAHNSLIVLMALTGVFFVVSIICHGVLASPKRKK